MDQLLLVAEEKLSLKTRLKTPLKRGGKAAYLGDTEDGPTRTAKVEVLRRFQKTAPNRELSE